ncbi:unnamed protein product [Urochloa humidicola]
MAGSAISAAASSLGGLATREASFLCGVHEEVELLREDLRSMQAYLIVPRRTRAAATAGSGTSRTKRRISSMPRITGRRGTEGARACSAP